MTVAKEMNNGVALLLERMKTHPEEFVPQYDGGATKWGNAIGQYRTYLTAEDNKALDDAWRETVVTAMQQKFTERVLEELVDPKSEKSQWGDSSITHLGGATQGHSTAIRQATNALNAIGTGYTVATNNSAVGTVTLPNGSITLGQTQLQEEQVKHMIAHLDWLKREEQLKEKEKPKTIFGRLHNYLGVNK